MMITEVEGQVQANKLDGSADRVADRETEQAQST